MLGLRWSDIDLKAKTLAIRAQARVLVEYKVRIEEPKSRNGHRTLPLDDALVEALTALRKRQLADGATAGTGYQAGLAALDWYLGGECLITDELGKVLAQRLTRSESALFFLSRIQSSGSV